MGTGIHHVQPAAQAPSGHQVPRDLEGLSRRLQQLQDLREGTLLLALGTLNICPLACPAHAPCG